MKRYDELFNEQQIRTLYTENKTKKEISEIVNIPIEPLRKRMHEANIKTRKATYRLCPTCEKQVPASMFQRHMKSHLWAIRKKIYCYHCQSQYVVKNGFSVGNQTILCRKCGRITSLGCLHSREQKVTKGLCSIAKILRKTGYTYRGIKEFMKRNYKLSIDEKTAWHWVKRS